MDVAAGVSDSTMDAISKASAIEIRDYSFRFAGARSNVLSHLNLAVGYGEFVVLSGDSGSGKSTLLASLIGSIPHIYAGDRSGRIFVDGRDVSDERIASRARFVGSVLQDADSQIVHARVGDEIAFGCENLGMRPEEIGRRVDEAAGALNLDTEAFTRTLSGGQKQRLITASALAMGRKILLLDEPLANLDKEGAEFLLGTLRDLARRGYAVLLAEHRLEAALPYANRHIRLADGMGEHKGDGSFCVPPFQFQHTPLQHKKNRPFCVDHAPSLRPPSRNLDSVVYEIADQARNDTVGVNGTSLTVGHERADDAVFILNNITYQTAGRTIIENASFYIKRGERIVILGENGCGKTTLLRLLARLIRPTGGSLEQRVAPGLSGRASPKWFAKVGYVYQNPNYQLFMPTVLEEIAYKAASTAEARRYAELFGLSELLGRHPHSLSEGQKRRLGIAAVCATRPEVLLLDEPTVGQDDDSLRRMIEALNHINGEYGTTLATVTHDNRCAEALADRTLQMSSGRVLVVY
jgi:energy-coupling factor transport system ATP-binding protein